MKGFTIKGPETLSCGNNAFEGLVGVSIQEGATLNLDSSVIQGCTFATIRVGAPPFLPNGPQIGHATITKTDITDYRAVGIVALTSGSTLTITKSNIIGFDDSNLVGQTGILVDWDAKGIITQNKITIIFVKMNFLAVDRIGLMIFKDLEFLLEMLLLEL